MSVHDGAESETPGGRIRARREALGLSQDELADQVGVRRPRISRWENDHALPRGQNLKALATALGVSETWILSGPEPDAVDRVRVADAAGLIRRGLEALEGESADTPKVPQETSGDAVLGILVSLLQHELVRAKGPDPFHAAIGAIEQLVAVQPEARRQTWSAYLEVSRAAGHYDPERVPAWTDAELTELRHLIPPGTDLDPDPFGKDTPREGEG